MSTSGKRDLDEDFGEFLLGEDSQNSSKKSSAERNIDLEEPAVPPSSPPLAKSNVTSTPPPAYNAGDEGGGDRTVKIEKGDASGKKKASGLAGGSVATDEIQLMTIKLGAQEQARMAGRENSPEKRNDHFQKGQDLEMSQSSSGQEEITAGAPAEPADAGSPQAPAAVPAFQAPLSGEAMIARAAHLRVAQEKILELENEIERLRTENEKFASAAETLQARVEDLSQKATDWEKKFRVIQDSHVEEKKLLHDSLLAKDREIERLRAKTGDLESRLAADLKKIRVRERELENRLELMKGENAALNRNKNEMILSLKRQLDVIGQEVDGFKLKKNAMNQQLTENRDRALRATKALRLALTMLEGEETNSDEAPPLRKAE